MGCVACVITRGVLSIRVFYRVLGGAYSRYEFKARHVLFRTDGVVLNKDGAKEDGNDRS